MPKRVKAPKDLPGSVYSTDIERCHALQFKYAILMEKEVESVTNDRLISFLEEWYGTPYQFGGDSKKGVDCSAFTCAMINQVYGLTLPRTSREQYKTGQRVNKSELLQGDLVFFNTTGGVSHVGVYLANNKFVHASTSSGVMISDLDDVYFKKRYVGAARLR
jgi:lipoprotein Spr